MGVIRYAHPVMDDAVSAASFVGGGSYYPGTDPESLYGLIVGRPDHSRTLDRSGNPVYNDDGWLDFNNNTQWFSNFFSPITGDDNIAKLVIHVRGSFAADLLFDVGYTASIDPIFRTGSTNYTLGTISDTTVDQTAGGFVNTDPINYTVTSTLNPATSASWTVSDLGLVTAHSSYPTGWGKVGRVQPYGASFGLNNFVRGNGADDFRVSSMYIAAHFSVGPTIGKSGAIEENWRWCDQCGRKTPYSKILRPQPPHPQTGLSVCNFCYDEPDHDTRKTMTQRVPRDREDPLY